MNSYYYIFLEFCDFLKEDFFENLGYLGVRVELDFFDLEGIILFCKLLIV